MLRNRPGNMLRTFSLLLGLVASLLFVDVAFSATEDIIHMADGRELHGQIVKETNTAVIFDYLNADLGISVTMTLPKASILKIERDVTIVEPEAAPAQQESSGTKDKVATTKAPPEGKATDATFYMVPMHGQVGTDIRSGIYEDVIEEIKSTKPDVVIIELDSKNIGNELITYWLGGDYDKESWQEDPHKREEFITGLMADQQIIVHMFRDKIPSDIRQVVWVKNATGPGAILALAWDEMYMHPDAFLGGLGELWAGTLFPDPDVRAKMQAATWGGAKGVMYGGGHSEILLEGMMIPFSPLSVSFVNRKPVWHADFTGDLMISPSWGFGSEIRHRPWPQGASGGMPTGYEFGAGPCEDMLISDGTAENILDLALLLDTREYRSIETEELLKVAAYKDEWRAKLDRALEALKEWQKYLQRGTLADLQKARKALAKLIGLVRNDKSVALRIRTKTGLDLIELEIMMDDLVDNIRQMARGGGGRGGGGGGGVGGGRGGGGGG